MATSPAEAAGFVELKPPVPTAAGTELELTAETGAMMTIRLTSLENVAAPLSSRTSGSATRNAVDDPDRVTDAGAGCDRAGGLLPRCR